MKKIWQVILCSTILCVLICGVVLFGRSQRNDNKKGGFAVNLNALTLPPEESGGSEQYKGYFNDVKTKNYSESKFEYRKDSTGVEIKVKFTRSCVSYYTYCEHSGKKDDICYGSLNGLVTNCANWGQDE